MRKRLPYRICADEEVELLLEDDVLGVGHAGCHHLHEQGAHVDADGHVVYDLFEQVPLGQGCIRFAACRAWHGLHR